MSTPLNDSPIFLAIRSGSTAELSALLARDPSLALSTNASNKTPLMMAAMEGSLDALEILLPFSKPWRRCPMTGLTALDIAVKNGRVECSSKLLKAVGWPGLSTRQPLLSWPLGLDPLSFQGSHLFSLAILRALPLDEARPAAIAARQAQCLAELFAHVPEPLSNGSMGLLLKASARLKALLCLPVLAKAASSDFFEIEALPGFNALALFATSLSASKVPFASAAFFELSELYFEKAQPCVSRASALDAIAILEASGLQSLADQLAASHERFELSLSSRGAAPSAGKGGAARL